MQHMTWVMRCNGKEKVDDARRKPKLHFFFYGRGRRGVIGGAKKIWKKKEKEREKERKGKEKKRTTQRAGRGGSGDCHTVCLMH